MSEKTIRVRIQVRQPGAKGDLARLLGVVPDVALVNGNHAEPASILIIEDSGGSDAEEAVRAALRTGAADEVFLVSDSVDPDLLIKAMRAGVKEFLRLPVEVVTLRDALERYRQRHEEREAEESCGFGQLVAVAGAKPGVGSSTLAVNLAAALASLARDDVALVDLCQPTGEVPLFLDLDSAVEKGGVSGNAGRLDPTFLRGLGVKHSSGLRAYLSTMFQDEDGYVSPGMLDRVFAVLRATYANTVADVDGSLDDTAMALLKAADTVLLVTTLSLPALAGARRVIETLRSLSETYERKVRLVVNSHLDGTGISLSEAEEILGRKAFLVLPHDYKAAQFALNRGQPLREAQPKARLTRLIDEAARRLCRKAPEEGDSGGFGLSRLLRRGNGSTQARPR